MRGLAFALLAALTLPITINGEGYDTRVAKKQLVRINTLEDEANRFYHFRAYNVDCSGYKLIYILSFKTYNLQTFS